MGIKITKKVVFHTNDYTKPPTIVKMEFNDEMISIIKKAVRYLNESKNAVHCVCLEFGADLYGEDDGKEKESEWFPTAEHLKVYHGCRMFYYAQSKYDCSDQIESDEINPEEIGIDVSKITE
jgi:hypothetical protein